MIKKILITGGSGVIGSAVVPLFANDPSFEVWILLRAQNQQHLQERFETLKLYWGSELISAKRIHCLVGDVTLPKFGLSSQEYKELSTNLTHILHCAANVDLDMPLAESLRNSVTATENILKLQKEVSGVKLDFVSTVGVNGRRAEALIESELTTPRNFFNTYEAGKAEAEKLLFKAIREGFFITLHRPSMVVGNSQNGKIIHFQVFYFLLRLLSGSLTKGWLPKLRPIHLDTIPSDFVAQVLYQSVNSQGTAGRIFHHCSGPDLAISITALQALFKERVKAHGSLCPNLHYLPPSFFRVISFLGHLPFTESRWRKRLKLFPQFLEYASQDQKFSNQITSNFLKSVGITVPHPKDYLEVVMDYYLKHQKI